MPRLIKIVKLRWPTHMIEITSEVMLVEKYINEFEGEYLTFSLGNEEYGINVLKVQEIRNYEHPTSLPMMPEHVLGILNLRGIIVPVVDMRIKLKLNPVEYNGQTTVVILRIDKQLIAMVVDSVSDVMNLNEKQILNAPNVISRINSEFISGLASVEDRVLILVSIEKFIVSSEMALLEQLGQSRASHGSISLY